MNTHLRKVSEVDSEEIQSEQPLNIENPRAGGTTCSHAHGN